VKIEAQRVEIISTQRVANDEKAGNRGLFIYGRHIVIPILTASRMVACMLFGGCGYLLCRVVIFRLKKATYLHHYALAFRRVFMDLGLYDAVYQAVVVFA